MDALEQIKITFFQECEDLLSQLEIGLLQLQSGDRNPETVNGIFRAVHSVKGGAGAFGFEDLVAYAHVFETALDSLRSGTLSLNEQAVAVFIKAGDILSDHVAAAQGGGAVDQAAQAAALASLEHLLSIDAASAPAPAAPAPSAPAADPFGFVPLAVTLAPLAAERPAGWTIQFTPADALYAKANDPVVLLRELARLGPCLPVLDKSRLPDLASLEAERSYLAWTIGLESDAAETAVREVFEFVDGDCALSIEAAQHKADEASVLHPEEKEAAPVVEPEPLPALASEPQASATSAAPASDISRPHTAGATIRVDLERIDRLINLVGELVINQAMLAQRASTSGFTGAGGVGSGLEELEQLTREIQDSVMAIRAQPVRSVFQRMPRLVRELAAATGKHVRLITDGEATEVDKTVIEQLTDPITHMIRNAIDHGLEKPEKRAATGKPEEGVVRLSAVHRSGRIVIEVSDDGAGIDRIRVRQIAQQKGLIAADAQLSDDETDNLIFLPGFSTAQEVSNISGRGVGMDVVKRSIQSLGGRISISSQPGKGSAFTLSLPLTLAVMDGMVVTAGEQTLIAPLTTVIETLRPKPHEVRTLGPTTRVVAIRETHVPMLDLGVMLGLRRSPTDPSEGVCLLVESEAGGRAALLVDAIQGQRQVVIKSLETNYRKVELIAAATILGDGRVALILDVDALIDASARLPVHNPPTLLAS